MPIVEAQIVGRPVVTSNCASMPEVAGDGAALVDPYSVDSIRAGFRQIIDNDAHRKMLCRTWFFECETFSIMSPSQTVHFHL